MKETKFGENWLVEQAIELQKKKQGGTCSKNQQEEINVLFVALAKAGAEEEEDNTDDANFVKETKFGENWLARRAIKLQEKVQGEACSQSQQEEIRRAAREELESLIERQCGKLGESSVREAEDPVMKQHWVSHRDFGAVVAGGGLWRRSWGDAEALKGMEAEKKANTEKFDVSGEGEEQEVHMVAGDMKLRVKRLAAKHRRDARATAKLESSSDSVTEKIIETSMGHVNNPLA